MKVIILNYLKILILICVTIFSACSSITEVRVDIVKISTLSNTNKVVEYCELELKDTNKIYKAEGNYCDMLEIGDRIILNVYLSGNDKVKEILIVKNVIE